MRYVNYGKGVGLPTPNPWANQAEATCWVNQQDVTSVDLYWFTDPFDGPGNRFGYKYGEVTSGGSSTRRPGRTGSRSGTSSRRGSRSTAAIPRVEGDPPAELRSAVWHSIIAGARGIMYFQHSFGGPHRGDHHTIRSNSEGTRPVVTSVNQQIEDLAPALNSPFVTSGHSMSGNVTRMVKWSSGKFYVFAGANTAAGPRRSACRASATRRPWWRASPARVPVTNGSFTDSFADKNAVHIYRIDGGSTCGLP